MTTATQTFAAFLDILAETLDLDSEARAARLHLSRFHLDRIVSSMGGEPPDRMRRRLLLERAYDTSPSTWRRQPTSPRIDAASRVHFHPPGSLRLPTQREVTPMELMTRMVDHHIWLVGEMLDRAEQLDAAALDARIELPVGAIDDDMSIRSVLGRLDDTFVDVTCQPAGVFTYGGMIAHVLTFAAVRRLVVLGAFEKHGITDLHAGAPMEWVAQPA